jgi:hypothetical protein
MVAALENNGILMKILILLLFISFSHECFAENNDQVVIALNRLNASIVKLKDVEEKCSENKIIISPNIFDNISASNDHKKIALKYFFLKNITDCSSEAVKDYLLASSIRIFADKNMPHSQRDADELIISNFLLFLKAEVEYNAISNENKKAFEAIKELHHPFDLIKASKALGLY